jgi:hypothetical protein
MATATACGASRRCAHQPRRRTAHTRVYRGRGELIDQSSPATASSTPPDSPRSTRCAPPSRCPPWTTSPPTIATNQAPTTPPSSPPSNSDTGRSAHVAPDQARVTRAQQCPVTPSRGDRSPEFVSQRQRLTSKSGMKAAAVRLVGCGRSSDQLILLQTPRVSGQLGVRDATISSVADVVIDVFQQGLAGRHTRIHQPTC